MMAGVMSHFLRWSVGLASPETQTLPEERECLQRHAKGKRRLAEIGVWHGVTTRQLRQVMHPDGVYFAIDPYPVGRLGISAQYVIAHMGVRRVRNGMIQWLRTTGVDAAKDLRVRSAPIDFLFIDGDHSFDGLRSDWEAWSGLITPGGIVALHDSRPTPTRPIHDAGSVLYTAGTILKDKDFSVVEVVESLTVLMRRP